MLAAAKRDEHAGAGNSWCPANGGNRRIENGVHRPEKSGRGTFDGWRNASVDREVRFRATDADVVH
jgi:hypothetical protein